MKALPSLSGLIAFDAVSRHLGFSRAGRELHITQGAVSHRIRALEEELGVALLSRTSRRVRLTASGRILFRATGEAFERLRQGLAEMRAATQSPRVTVSCSPSFAIRWLVPHLGAMRKQFPEIDVHISAEDELVEPGTAGIDVCLRFGPGDYEHVTQECLTEERVVAVCSSLYAERLSVHSPTDLARCVLLHDDVLSEHKEHVGWEEWLRAAGLSEELAQKGLHFSHAHLALDAAAAGQGVALARRTLVRQDLRDGRLILPFALEIESGLRYWLITPHGSRPNEALDSFCSWLRRALQEE